MIPFLNKTNNWLDFSDGIKIFLIIESQFDWLEDHKNTLAIPSTEWKRKYKFVIYAIRAQSNYNTKQIINRMSNYYTAYKTFEKNYKP